MLTTPALFALPRSRHRVRRVLPVVLTALSLAVAGCLGSRRDGDNPAPEGDTPGFDVPTSQAGEDESPFGRPVTNLVVEFNVHRYTAPRGTFTPDSAVIWQVVTGPLPSAETALHLADSGFRAAIGRQSDRKPLAEALETLRESTDLRSAVDHITPDASRAMEMEIGPVSWSSLPVFYVQGDGSLAGQDFLNATTKFLMNFAIRAERMREVWVQIVPAIDEPPGPLRWVGTAEGGFQQVAEQRRKVFSDVVLDTPVPDGGFILLGATPSVYDRPYLARPFFIEQDPGGKGADPDAARESIFIISPILRTVRPDPAESSPAAQP
ncbi:MAG: hypothetical protein DCC65_00895 [Planctomycetota bacterium]|nr:MAG: hypothetical protein DCC65_00895 [Planctomycetota bacterium]